MFPNLKFKSLSRKNRFIGIKRRQINLVFYPFKLTVEPVTQVLIQTGLFEEAEMLFSLLRNK